MNAERMLVVERGGNTDEVHKPRDNRLHAIQSQVDQLWEDDGDWCS